MKNIRYNHLNSYLKEKFGERTLKICVDGGFTCPNRDGRVSFGGCLFCGAMGAGENIKFRTENILESIRSQVCGFLSSYRGERANKFIVYFQSFSNTYGDVEELKKKYDTALASSDKIVGLEVATRPDCISERVAELLASYKDKYYVCVELGLQTANDKIGEALNRGYSTQDFINATKLLKSYGIDVVAHIMIGLPDEKEGDVFDTINLINSLGCNGVKIHSTYVIEGTGLAELLKDGKYVPITQEYYVEMVSKIIRKLNRDIIIHRINADPPKSLFLAPEWALHKKLVLNDITRKLAVDDIYQGVDV